METVFPESVAYLFIYLFILVCSLSSSQKTRQVFFSLSLSPSVPNSEDEIRWLREDGEMVAR